MFSTRAPTKLQECNMFHCCHSIVYLLQTEWNKIFTMWDSMWCNLKWGLFLPTALITLMRWESITLQVGRGITDGVNRQDEDYCSDQELTITQILPCNTVNSDFLFHQLIRMTMYQMWFFSHYHAYFTETSMDEIAVLTYSFWHACL